MTPLPRPDRLKEKHPDHPTEANRLKEVLSLKLWSRVPSVLKRLFGRQHRALGVLPRHLCFRLCFSDKVRGAVC